jgi:hypothetical protein
VGYLSIAELFGFELGHRTTICDEPERNGEEEFFIHFEGLRIELRVPKFT